MERPGLVLFDDRQARSWEPLTLTRPAGELIFGALKLVERVERAFGLRCLGYLTSDHLADYLEPDGRPTLRADALPKDRALLFWCARAAPELAQSLDLPTAGATYLIAGQPVGRLLPAGQQPPTSLLEDLRVAQASGPEIKVEGRLLQWVWDLMLETPEQVARDLSGHDGPRAAGLPSNVHRIGDEALFLGANVRIEPGVVFDLRNGPIRLGDDVEVRAGTRLAGPAEIGPRSRLFGGALEAIATGPYSYLRGEVAESVTLGYVNKAHDGHLGHAYLGRWVNLGALTTNSDLKNNYRPVRVWTPEGVRDTGHIKIGCFLGDHVKTGIGLMIGTGTLVGAGANLYGNAMPPRYVQPFSWGEGEELTEYRLAAFLATAATAMARRGVTLDERGRRYLESCWRKGRGG